jgi:cupin 2 domain-containing protein
MSSPDGAAVAWGNLFADGAAPAEGERFDTLLACGPLQIERIVSSARARSEVFVQPQDEWVLLVQGSATLQVGDMAVSLQAGDHVFLPAHTPHQVLDTSEGAMWLAVHLHPQPLTPRPPG